MPKTILRQAIEKHVSLSNVEWMEIAPLFEHRKLPKDNYLIKPGQVCNEFSFILKGGFRIYVISSKGEEAVSWLPFEHNFISELMSFFVRSPTYEYIQALEDSELLTITYANMMELYERFPKWEKFGRLIAEDALINVKRYILSTKNETGEDRYRRIMEESPEILRRAPLRDVASYIGVTPSSLSRIRRSYAS